MKEKSSPSYKKKMLNVVYVVISSYFSTLFDILWLSTEWYRITLLFMKEPEFLLSRWHQYQLWEEMEMVWWYILAVSCVKINNKWWKILQQLEKQIKQW